MPTLAEAISITQALVATLMLELPYKHRKTTNKPFWLTSKLIMLISGKRMQCELRAR